MDAAVKNNEVDREHAEAESGASRADATFTEIYELILHNQSLVKAELEVLQQLIQKKLMQNVQAAPAEPRIICGRFHESKL